MMSAKGCLTSYPEGLGSGFEPDMEIFCSQRQLGAKLALTEPVAERKDHGGVRHGSFSFWIVISTTLACREAACFAC